jgi:hypothetical protein
MQIHLERSTARRPVHVRLLLFLELVDVSIGMPTGSRAKSALQSRDGRENVDGLS